MATMTGAELAVALLARYGVDTVFGIPGVHTLPFYDALQAEPRIRHITVRHEQGAAMMADGYARATGRPGVAVIISGPGLTNAATGVGQAYSDSSPVVILSGDVESGLAGGDHGVLHDMRDQPGLMRSLCAWSRRIEAADQIPSALADAFGYQRRHRPRPVHIAIPLDLQAATVDVDLQAQPPLPDGAEAPDPAAVCRAAAALARSARPLLWLGGGAAGAGELCVRLAERLGMAVLTTAAGKGIVPEDHALSLGARMEEPAVQDFVAGCDLMLAVGTELAEMETRGWQAKLPPVIRVDMDPAALQRNYHASEAVLGDAGQVLGALLAGVGPAGFGGVPPRGDFRAEVAGLKASLRFHPAPFVAQDPVSAHTQADLLAAIREALPPDGVLVNDMTVLSYTAVAQFPALRPRSFLFPRGFGTLGFSLPAAIGASLGLPGRPVVAISGDGGLLFTIAELATAVRYKVPLPVLVINNGGYGIIRQHQLKQYGRVAGVDTVNPDFPALARAFGAYGERTEPRRLAEMLRRAWRRDGPTLIEVEADI